MKSRTSEIIKFERRSFVYVFNSPEQFARLEENIFASVVYDKIPFGIPRDVDGSGVGKVKEIKIPFNLEIIPPTHQRSA